MLLLRNTQRVLDSKEYLQSSAPATSLVDRSRWGNNGTFSNVTWVQLPSGTWVMNFNGTDSYVEIPDSPTMRMAQGGTIKCWVYARTRGETAGRIVHKGSNNSASDGYLLAMNNSVSGGIYAQVNAGTILISNASVVPFSVWKQAVITFSSAGRKIYVNAVDVTASGGGETALPPNTAGNVRLGNIVTATDRTFDGYISPVKMYSKVFTQADVTRSYTAERSLYGV